MSYLQKSLEHAQKDMARLQIITVYRLSRNNIRLQCLELSNNMLQEHIVANKGMDVSTNCLEQNSLTDHEPKRHRRYEGTHVNMANDMTDSNMAGTTISRHVGELVPLTTEH